MIDFNIDKGSPVKSNDIEIVLQQIDILFDTIPTEVLGSEDFGTKYDTYLYDLNISASNLEQQVYSDLYSLDLLGFTPKVEVHLLQGTEQDIALIDITLSRDDETYNKVYKIDR